MIYLILLIITCFTTTISGIQWISGFLFEFNLENLQTGLPYSLSILFILGCHEFGHYFAAKFHKVPVTLPYFIPFPPIPGFINFGTMGAVIRTKSIIPNNRAMFDIGVYGPIAGFVASLFVLIYGFTHLPGIDYITNIHPDYFSDNFAADAMILQFGDSILFHLLGLAFTKPDQFMPPMSEIYHYPYLCAGWFGLFITSMNMIPIGQLDGGHIIYSMLGNKKHVYIAKTSLMLIIALGISGIISPLLGWQGIIGWTGWLVWAALLYFLIKIHHPPVLNFYELDNKRKVLGYFTLLILVITFSPAPIIIKF